jgi:hypothetical protein
MVNLKDLDKHIIRTLNSYEIKSFKELKQKLDKKYIDVGVNWYIKKKYQDYLAAETDPLWQLTPTWKS